MATIKLDPLSEETITPLKVSRGPKPSSSSLAVTKVTETDDLKHKKAENVTVSEEMRAIKVQTALETVKLHLYNAIEEASVKSAEIRLNGFKKIVDILIHHYIPEVVDDKKLEITDLIEKSLRRVKGLDHAVAAKIAVLLVIQLGYHYKKVQLMNQYIVKGVSDESNKISARADCCSILGVMHFLRNEIFEDIEKMMRIFKNIFDCGNEVVSENESVLHSAAIFSWALLFTKVSSEYSNLSTLPILTNYLINLLDSPHLKLRVAAGETICLILEYSRATDNTSLSEIIEGLVDVTKLISHDKQKLRYKDDLKMQRATFRDISRYIAENIQPDIKIVFGNESIQIKTWALHHQYVALCSVIGPGMVTHLTQNEFIRKVLNVDEIGVPLSGKLYKQIMHRHSGRMIAIERRDERRYKYDFLG